MVSCVFIHIHAAHVIVIVIACVIIFVFCVLFCFVFNQRSTDSRVAPPAGRVPGHSAHVRGRGPAQGPHHRQRPHSRPGDAARLPSHTGGVAGQRHRPLSDPDPPPSQNSETPPPYLFPTSDPISFADCRSCCSVRWRTRMKSCGGTIGRSSVTQWFRAARGLDRLVGSDAVLLLLPLGSKDSFQCSKFQDASFIRVIFPRTRRFQGLLLHSDCN